MTDRFDPPTQGEAGLDIVDYVQALVELAGGSGELTVEEIGLDSLELVTLSLALERFLAAKVGAGWLSDEMFDLRTVQYITVGTLKQVVEDIDAGRSNRQALASLYRRAAESVAERDALAMRADACQYSTRPVLSEATMAAMALRAPAPRPFTMRTEAAPAAEAKGWSAATAPCLPSATLAGGGGH